MRDDRAGVLFSKQRIAKRVKELGAEISRDFLGRKITVVCVLKGASIFFSDLVRAIDAQVEFAFVTASSYRGGMKSCGEPEISFSGGFSAEDKDILIVDDVADTGITLLSLKELLMKSGAGSVKVCALLDKPSCRKVEMAPDYTGFTAGDKFVVGYGMDFGEEGRNLPYIRVLDGAEHGD